ncbi:DUF3203 family protein [Pseudomonas sp. 10B1]|uniref:DUF3203 family protein n=1 Tax=unclassified Pseudomonas TaxID=196821 RepID=UPI002AB3A40B|nr:MULTISPECIES: DUF3203 family protein [unclassified Pseudomonas]MDY7560109.1 DUF3203 family protein [Pseudomonas sp. AB6]MEA9975724.1 DUF3203 family protein [Pseudomonas sp. RTS4]MEA9995737.1 DUF3203 family protein [Pseudomonas sp. AA4]MEB0085530.1 DUF3203 family protein [Pseudomonas sp. RTI1]MEB0124592.1 DUF3203 family protein [Pseudomonas sp. CCC1.2]
MPLQFDNTREHCSAVIEEVRYESPIIEVVIITNDATHMSEAQIDGQSVSITEDEADSLTVLGALDKRHHTVVD